MFISLDGITKRFGSTLALSNISTALTGRVSLFLGANGSGKSTLLNVLAGITYPETGTLVIGGVKCSAKDKDGWRRALEGARKTMGFLLDKPGYPSYMTGLDLLHWQSNGNEENTQWIERMIKDLSMSLYIRRKIGGYSSGMKQKLGIVASLVSRPDLVLWDEPTSNLDARSRSQVANLVKEFVGKSTSFIIASHTPADFEGVADWVGLMRLGALIKSGPLPTFTNESRIYNVETDKPVALAAKLLESGMAASTTVGRGRVTFEASVGFDECILSSRAGSSGINLTSISRQPKTLTELSLEALAG